MYDYVIKKYKAKYANLIKIEEKGNRLEEGRIVYNWYESLSSFYENLKALQDCKVILAKEKYILCEFTYLMLNLVDKSNPDKYSITPTQLIPILVKAIQELSAKVKTLENPIS